MIISSSIIEKRQTTNKYDKYVENTPLAYLHDKINLQINQ